MSEYIKIPVTQEMRNDLANCEAEAEFGAEKNCFDCSLNGGEFGCLADYDWIAHQEAEEALTRKE